MTDSNQRAVLIAGTELALYVTNRPGVYLDASACLSLSPVRNDLRKSLVSLYTHVLEVLAYDLGYFSLLSVPIMLALISATPTAANRACVAFACNRQSLSLRKIDAYRIDRKPPVRTTLRNGQLSHHLQNLRLSHHD